jgi:hypothetical protein
MLTNDTVNLLTLVLRSALPTRVAATTLTAFQLLVLQLQFELSLTRLWLPHHLHRDRAHCP